MTDTIPTTPTQPANNREVPIDPERLRLEIPRRAIDYAQLLEEDIRTRVGEIDPRELHTMAGEALEDQVTESLETDAPADEILLKSDALLMIGIQQAAAHVETEENSIVAFDAMGGEASETVTAAVENLAGDELTEPIARAAIQVLEDGEATDPTELPEAA